MVTTKVARQTLEKICLEKRLETIYQDSKKYNDNLTGMLQGGFARMDGDRVVCTLKGRIVAATALFFKKALRLGDGG